MIRRTFIIGSEWLFYKIYTGPKTADRILTEVIKPVSEELLKNGLIDSWFFIRYSDPKFHLRVRFHQPNFENNSSIIQMLYDALLPFVDSNLIWKITTDTYSREIERYGLTLIESVEKYFFIESTMIVNILDILECDQQDNIRWLAGIKITNEILDLFRFDFQHKILFIQKLRDGYGKEFGLNKDVKLQLAKKYRINKSLIEMLFTSGEVQEDEVLSVMNLIVQYKNEIKSIVEKFILCETNQVSDVPVESLVQSILHMMVNRLFRSKQRMYELVLYDFLFQYLSSVRARNLNGCNESEIEKVNNSI